MDMPANEKGDSFDGLVTLELQKPDPQNPGKMIPVPGVRPDTKKIRIFRDHLARDVANFQHGHACAPQIELPDGTKASGGTGLECGVAVSHAQYGLDLFTGKYDNIKGKGWTEKGGPGGYTWAKLVEEKISLARGWKLRLGMVAAWVHVATVMEEGTVVPVEGQRLARIYSANAFGQKFARFGQETVEGYYINGLSPLEGYRWLQLLTDPNATDQRRDFERDMRVLILIPNTREGKEKWDDLNAHKPPK
jgi:hypothetical protein